MRAVTLVEEAHMTMARAAEQYSVTVNQIGSILAWGKLRKLTQPEIELTDKVRNPYPRQTEETHPTWELRDRTHIPHTGSLNLWGG